MERDIALFPKDNIGDALWTMLQAGDDLAQVREIEFSMLFPTEELALKFGQILLENNQKLSFCAYADDANFPWEITAYPEIAALHDHIAAYQDLLITSGEPLQGKFDGWYCISASKLPY